MRHFFVLVSIFVLIQSNPESIFRRIKILNEKNFDSFHSENQNLALYLYLPKTKDRTQLTNLFSDAYSHFKNTTLNIEFARIDCVKDHSFCENFNVTKIPQIAFFNNEKEIISFNGKKNIQSLTEFLYKELDEKKYLKKAESLDELKELSLKERTNIIIFVGNPEKFKKDFSLIRRSVESLKKNHLFYFSEKSLFPGYESLEGEYCVFMLKNGNIIENLNFSNLIPLTLKKIHKRIKVYEKDHVSKLNEMTLSDISEHGKSTIIIIDEKAKKNDNILNIFNNLAKNYRETLSFKVGFSEKLDLNEIQENYKVSFKKFPVIFILSGNNKLTDLANYYPFSSKYGEITENSLREYIEDFKNGKLEKLFISENLPEIKKNEYGVENLVGLNLKEFLLESRNGTRLYIFTCQKEKTICHEAENRINLISKRLQEKFNVKFGKIDPNLNEIDSIPITQSSPSLIYYYDSNGNGLNPEVIEFDDPSFQSIKIIEFINSTIGSEIENSIFSEEEIKNFNFEIILQNSTLGEDTTLFENQIDENYDEQIEDENIEFGNFNQTKDEF